MFNKQFPAEMISDKFKEAIRHPTKVHVSCYFCEREKSFIKSARPPTPLFVTYSLSQHTGFLKDGLPNVEELNITSFLKLPPVLIYVVARR